MISVFKGCFHVLHTFNETQFSYSVSEKEPAVIDYSALMFTM